MTINNSTISGNSTYAGGGGIYNKNGTLTLNNVTLSNNTTSTSGGGILNDGGTVMLRNSIVAGNTANSGADCSGSVGSVGYNLIGNTSGCTFTTTTGDKINQDPLLSPLVGVFKYHTLHLGSPAIDAGNPAVPGSGGNACQVIDQRGVARPQGSTCDMGSYEYKVPGPAATITVLSGSPQHTSPLKVFTSPLNVLVLDNVGIPVDGVSVTFTAPSSGASGTFADTGTRITTASTDEGGMVTASTLTANGILGAFNVNATVTGVASPAVFALENLVWYVTPGGNDLNSCTTTGSPCLTINGALGKATDGETINVATGTYSGPGTEVVQINKSVTLSGGWNASFIAQSGTSTIDGQGARKGIAAYGEPTVVIDYFTVQNGVSSLYGGGIYTDGELTLNNSTVTNNTASEYGGGISSWGIGALTINNSIISDNTAGGGGGISAINATLTTLNNSSVINNHAISGGGIWTGQNLTINNTTIKDNTASENGGGIFIYATNNMTLNNSTITGNQALNGGGILLSNYSSGGTPQKTTIRNSTISNNTAQTGGGINMEYSFPARVVTVRNSIIAKNTAASNADCSGSISASNHNIIGDTSGCTITAGTGNQLNVDPLISVNAISAPAYHFLLAGSPAINAGNPASPGSGGSACLATDQRGVVRPVGSACDIGAYEADIPIIASIKRLGINPTGEIQVEFMVTFSESVTGVDPSDFTLAASGTTGAVITSVSGPDDTYTVTVNTGSGSGNGAIRLRLIDDDSILDSASNPLGGPGAGNGNFTTGEVYSLIRIPVTVSPTNLIVDTTPTYKWSKIPGATKYQYELWNGTTLVYTKNTPDSNCSASPCSSTPATTLSTGNYKWRVRAMIGGVWKNFSPYKTFKLFPAKPGFWQGSGLEFYVISTTPKVDNFAIYITVNGCGNYKITHTPLAAISNKIFSFAGSFYANGTFTTPLKAKGTLGLKNFYIPGCGYVSGGPFSWTATWMNSSQPDVMFNNGETFELTVSPEFNTPFDIFIVDPEK